MIIFFSCEWIAVFFNQVLGGWLRKQSRKKGAWDRRYFRVDPDEKRLYYSHSGPAADSSLSTAGAAAAVMGDAAPGRGGRLRWGLGALASTFRQIVDGGDNEDEDDDENETWVDLRLIPEIAPPRGRRPDPTRFNVDLG